MDALRRRIILAAANTPTPERVAYIRGGGDGSYIDTGIKPDINTRIVVWGKNWVPGSGTFFGTRNGQTDNEFEVAANSLYNTNRLRFSVGAFHAYVENAITDCFSNYHKYEINGSQFLIDDELRAVSPETAVTCSYNLVLFGLNNGGTMASMTYPADIIACKIYQNGVLVRDFTPVRTPSAGLYDAVTDTVFGNSGDGELSYNEYNPYAYTPIKYVTCTSEQYIDTGIIGGYNTPFVTQVVPKASKPKWNIPVSARYSEQKRCEFFFGNTSKANSHLSAGYSGNTQQIIQTPLYGAKIELVKANNVFTAYKDNAQFGTQRTFSVSTDYTTNQSFVIGGTFENETFLPAQSFEGDIYFAGFGKDGNYVPAVAGGVAGFYDTYNDKFHESKTDKPFIAGPGFNEPKESKMVPYIRGGGDGSYIDAGISPDSTTTLIVWARNFTPNGKDYSWLAGSRRTYNDSAFNIYADNNKYIGRIGLTCANSSTLPVSDGWKYFTDYHKYEISNGALYVDDKLLTATTNTSFVAPFSIHIIGMNNSGTHVDSNVRLDICACQIYKGGQLVRDFVPKQENGVIGLYDKVSDTLFTNVGTGSLEYGEFRTDAYERLEYIFTDANAYIDTGVYGKYSDDILARIMTTATEPRWHNLFGCRAVNSCFEVAFGLNTAPNENTASYWRCGVDSGSTHAKVVFTGKKITNKDVVIRKIANGTALYVYSGSTGQLGAATTTNVDTAFTTTQTLCLGTIKENDGVIRTEEMFRGRIYYFRLGNERSFIPVRKNNEVGLYDTYHDTFYPSLSDSPFVAGPVLR